MPTYGRVVQHISRIVAALLIVVTSRICVKNEESCQPKKMYRPSHVTTTQPEHTQLPASRCVSSSYDSSSFIALDIVNDSERWKRLPTAQG